MASFLFGNIPSLWLKVEVEAEHMCMTARGIKKPGSVTMTSAVRGRFKSDEKTRAEALSLLGY